VAFAVAIAAASFGVVDLKVDFRHASYFQRFQITTRNLKRMQCWQTQRGQQLMEKIKQPSR
jgi:hypothetical protein